MSRNGRYLILALISLSIVALDQISKVQIMQTMRLHESIPVVSEFFSLTYIRNPGAAFGLLASSGQTFRLIFFGLTSVFALGLLGMIFYRLRQDDWVGQLSIAGILGDRQLIGPRSLWRSDRFFRLLCQWLSLARLQRG
jgi:signal peptidase II